MKRFFFIFFLIILCSYRGFSQISISGLLADDDTQKTISYAHIAYSKNNLGAVSDENGHFEINVPDIKGFLVIQALGYEKITIPFDVQFSENMLDTIFLKPVPFELEETVITAGLSKHNITPVAVSDISGSSIQEKLGDRPLPLTFNQIPGIYSIRNGGGSGDAELSIRGFGQENVTIMLNGIPINGIENGLVYWSNWLGLSNAAAKIQIQKGPGLANLGNSAVGGSVNIITHQNKETYGGMLSYQMSSYGNQQVSFALNSGKLDNGWGISMMGSYMQGPGYVDATYVKGWSYFLSMNKTINAKKKISIILLGAPQRHGQRTLKLTHSESSLHGNKFNKDWGSYNGQINNASENFYHKPFMSVNYYLDLSDNIKLTNIIYLTAGNGGGKWSESFNYAPTIFEFRNPSGQIDWPEIYDVNASHEGNYTLDNGETVNGYSLNVQTRFLASHVEAGYNSTYEQHFGEHIDLTAGIHYRYFNSYLREEIIDLLGGQSFIEDYSWAVDGVAGRSQLKTVGDIIKVNNNSIVNYLNSYAQLLYKQRNLDAYISFNINNNWYQRVDRYNYVQHQKSETILKPGFDTRAGLSYQVNKLHTLYINGAFISRAPYFKFVFGNFTNQPVQNLKNEQIQTIEAGYNFIHPQWKINIGGYYTHWKNVSVLSNEYIQLEDNKQTRAMINGLNALHKGIEMKIQLRITPKLKMGGIVSFGDYKWTNNVTAQLFNNNNVVIDTVDVFVKDLYVGGTAQQQYGLFLDAEILKLFQLKAEYMGYNKIYADFEPTTRNNPLDHQQSYRIPSYGIINLYLGTRFHLFKKVALVQLNAYNLLNNIHIEDAEDGINHDLETIQGFWSFGRNFEISLRLNF
ncbi:MAG: TonB-dependent receptor plug domain-containing protein [Bacteroidales bacterium]|jgi:outer membrane receptor protein involved in Fe transport|nr:TonB-dependent receptor plug domain-containing protein [Bacteroidales bacterium]